MRTHVFSQYLHETVFVCSYGPQVESFKQKTFSKILWHCPSLPIRGHINLIEAILLYLHAWGYFTLFTCYTLFYSIYLVEPILLYLPGCGHVILLTCMLGLLSYLPCCLSAARGLSNYSSRELSLSLAPSPNLLNYTWLTSKLTSGFNEILEARKKALYDTLWEDYYQRRINVKSVNLFILRTFLIVLFLQINLPYREALAM